MFYLVKIINKLSKVAIVVCVVWFLGTLIHILYKGDSGWGGIMLLFILLTILAGTLVFCLSYYYLNAFEVNRKIKKLKTILRAIIDAFNERYPFVKNNPLIATFIVVVVYGLVTWTLYLLDMM